MKITDFVNIEASKFPEIMTAVKTYGKSDVMKWLKQMNPMEHDVMKTDIRKDKIINTSSTDGPEKASDLKIVKVARIPFALQKQITSRAAAFLCGNPITYEHAPLTDQQQPIFDVFTKIIDDNKVDYKNIDLANKMMGETQVAEIWYAEKVADKDPDYWNDTAAKGAQYRLRMKVVAASLGDDLYPVFDDQGDMIAFGRGYKVSLDKKTVNYFELYAQNTTYKANDSSGSYVMTPEPNPFKKINIVYYCQDLPEWSDVQPLIERLETSTSNTADTNDYFGAPILLAYGNVTGFSDKGEQGKLLQISGTNGKVEYLTWETAAEAVKNETDLLLRMIYNLTDTPNISLEEMKSVNTFSGVALKMLFLAAHMKAATKAGNFGESVQRRINLIKAAIATIAPNIKSITQIKIEPKFKYFLPDNPAEMIDILTKAVYDKPVMSQETAVAMNPFVTDPKKEIEKMQEEATAAADVAPGNLNID